MRWLLIFLLLAAGPAWAADAAHPDRNVDQRNDHGGDTGNGKVDTLNKGQLDENQPPPPGNGQPPSAPSVPAPR